MNLIQKQYKRTYLIRMHLNPIFLLILITYLISIKLNQFEQYFSQIKYISKHNIKSFIKFNPLLNSLIFQYLILFIKSKFLSISQIIYILKHPFTK